jgi:hypothetical protein
MTEQEKDEFTTELAVRYAQVNKYNSYNNELIISWDQAIATLPPEIKQGFEDKHNRLAEHKGEQLA